MPARLRGDLSTVKDALYLPRPGDTQLLCLTPELLELTLVTTKPPDPAPAAQWNFAGLNGQLHLPATNEVVVTVAEQIARLLRWGSGGACFTRL